MRLMRFIIKIIILKKINKIKNIYQFYQKRGEINGKYDNKYDNKYSCKKCRC